MNFIQVVLACFNDGNDGLRDLLSQSPVLYVFFACSRFKLNVPFLFYVHWACFIFYYK